LDFFVPEVFLILFYKHNIYGKQENNQIHPANGL